MGTVLVLGVVLLLALNALRMMRRQKKAMLGQRCSGDCARCQTPCQAQKICRSGPGAQGAGRERSGNHVE